MTKETCSTEEKDDKTPTGRGKDRDKNPELPGVEKLPGLGKYDSEGEEGEIEEKKMDIERGRRKEYAREEGHKKEEKNELQKEEKQAGSRERRETSRERDRKRRSSSRERKMSGDRGRERDWEGRDRE